jgi:hypothetical protein
VDAVAYRPRVRARARASLMVLSRDMQSRHAWSVVSGTGWCLLFVSFFGGLAAGSLRDAFFSSDMLYLPTLLTDLARWGGRFRDWHLTPAPYLFPDLPLYAFAALSTPSLEWALFSTGCLQLCLIVFAAQALVRRCLPQCAGARASIPLVYALWLTRHATNWSSYVLPISLPSIHGGAVMIVFTVFALCLRPAARPARLGGTLVVAALSGLTAASDALFVVSCLGGLGPAVLATALASWRRQGIPRSPLLLGRAIAAAAATVIGSGLASLFLTGSLPAAQQATAQRRIETMHALLGSSDPATRELLVLLAVSAGLALGVLLLRRLDAGLRVLSYMQLGCTLAVLLGVVFIGGYGDHHSLRYFVVPVNLALVGMCSFASRALSALPSPRDPSHAWTSLALAGVSGLVCALALNAVPIARAEYRAPQRSAAACVERIARREGVTTVLSDYWRAKPLMLFSDRRIHALQIRKGLQPYWWINSRGWYRGSHQFGIVIVDGLDLRRLKKPLGEPQQIERCEDLQLYVYRGVSRLRLQREIKKNFDTFLATSDAPRWR